MDDKQPDNNIGRSSLQLQMKDTMTQQSQQASLLGQQLGNYQLVTLLAQGGFAAVYLGEHVHLGTNAAIKVLQARLMEKDLRAFRDEARIVARLRHPHIVSIHDYDVRRGMPFLVMDYAPNGTLRHRYPKGTILEPQVIMPYLKQVADALQYAHDRHLVHRDVKPENMLLGLHDELLLSDFGIAVVSQSSRIEKAHEVLGTITYMSPEHFKGKALPASDQYSLAVVVYEWLCGECPFEGATSDIATQHLREVPPSLCARNPNIPPALEEVVFKGMAKDPVQRYPSVMAFAHAFEQACPQAALLLRGSTALSPDAAGLAISGQYHEATVWVPPVGQDGGYATSGPRRVRGGGLLGGRESRRAFLLAGAVSTVGLAAIGTIFYFGMQSSGNVASTTPAATPTNSAQGKILLTHPFNGGQQSALAWSGSDVSMASIYTNATVHVWNSTMGADTIYNSNDNDQPSSLAWSPNGANLAVGYYDSDYVRIWGRKNTDEPLRTYKKHQDSINAVTWSPDGQYIASASGKNVHIWQLQDGSRIHKFSLDTGSVRLLAWATDNTSLATVSDNDTNISIWNVSSSNLNDGPTTTLSGYSSPINNIAWSPDWRYLASANVDATVRVWDVRSKTVIFTYNGHKGAVRAVAWSLNGQQLASAADDGTVQVWHFNDGGNAYTFTKHAKAGSTTPVVAVAWSPSREKGVIASADQRTVLIWQV